MGRLKGRGFKPRTKPPASRFRKHSPSTERERSQRRRQDHDWRGWYGKAEWQKLRLEILKRDKYICQVTGERLSGRYPAPNSPVVDHKIPHRGDPALFWDPGNLQAVSKQYHDTEKQRLERNGEI